MPTRQAALADIRRAALACACVLAGVTLSAQSIVVEEAVIYADGSEVQITYQNWAPYSGMPGLIGEPINPALYPQILAAPGFVWLSPQWAYGAIPSFMWPWLQAADGFTQLAPNVYTTRWGASHGLAIMRKQGNHWAWEPWTAK